MVGIPAVMGLRAARGAGKGRSSPASSVGGPRLEPRAAAQESRRSARREKDMGPPARVKGDGTSRGPTRKRRARVTLPPGMNHPARTARLAVLPLLALAIPVAGASFPPHLRFCSISGARVTVHYHQGLEAMARQAAALATEILERHEARYHHRVGRLQIVLTDVEDDPNGYSTPFPYPLVYIRAPSPDGSDDFGNFTGWLRYVLTHELAHSVHLDEGRGIVRAGRKAFGRAPYLFPNLFPPTWMIAGLATYEETEGTAFGRGRNPDAGMVLRMAALEGAFLREDQAVLAQDRWPEGQASYLFGEAFLSAMTGRSGPATLPELARVQAGHLIPY